MKTSLLSLLAGTVLIASASLAGAAEPIALSSAQLDNVTAGGFYFKKIVKIQANCTLSICANESEVKQIGLVNQAVVTQTIGNNNYVYVRAEQEIKID